jgi:hypothetical protein
MLQGSARESIDPDTDHASHKDIARHSRRAPSGYLRCHVNMHHLVALLRNGDIERSAAADPKTRGCCPCVAGGQLHVRAAGLGFDHEGFMDAACDGRASAQAEAGEG